MPGGSRAGKTSAVAVEPSTAAAGVEYWRDRAAALGDRSVISTDHDGALDDISAGHRALLLPQLADFLPLTPGPMRTVLDLGCGSGRLTADLALLAGRAIGVDPVEELLALAPAVDNVEYRHLPAGDAPLPVDDGEVSVAFTCLVLGGIRGDDALRAIGDELERVLVPCGIVFLAESVSAQPDAGHWSFRSVEDYARAMPWAGLQEVGRFDDAGDAVSIMAGRKPALPQ